jgi:hypothetical protein
MDGQCIRQMRRAPFEGKHDINLRFRYGHLGWSRRPVEPGTEEKHEQ